MLRAVGAILAGLAAAAVLIALLDLAANTRWIAGSSAGFFAAVLAGWCLATFAGTFVAARVGRSAAYGFVIGGAMLAATVVHFFMMPHPYWMWIAGIVIVVVTAFIAIRSAIPARKSAA